MKWRLRVTPKVQETLPAIPPQTKRYIRQAFDELVEDPWQGKLLRDELTGFYSFRVKRFRIVYQIQKAALIVMVVGVGPRETIYEEIAAEIGSQ